MVIYRTKWTHAHYDVDVDVRLLWVVLEVVDNQPKSFL